jgi:hypothetical protein
MACPVAQPGGVFGGAAQPLAAKDQNDNDDQENETEAAAANIEGAGQNRCEYEVHGFLSFLMAIHLPPLSGLTLRDGPALCHGV